MVLCLAGRRIDAPDQSSPSFPLANFPLVEQRLRVIFSSEAKAIVSSAACGIDLIGLKLAGEMNIPATIILPTEPELFKKESVMDRPGDWERLYDNAIKLAKRMNTLVVLRIARGKNIYREVNRRIVDEGISQAGSAASVLAVAGWEGRSKGTSDNTANFIEEAVRKSVAVAEVSTL